MGMMLLQWAALACVFPLLARAVSRETDRFERAGRVPGGLMLSPVDDSVHIMAVSGLTCWCQELPSVNPEDDYEVWQRIQAARESHPEETASLTLGP